MQFVPQDIIAKQGRQLNLVMLAFLVVLVAYVPPDTIVRTGPQIASSILALQVRINQLTERLQFQIVFLAQPVTTVFRQVCRTFLRIVLLGHTALLHVLTQCVFHSGLQRHVIAPQLEGDPAPLGFIAHCKRAFQLKRCWELRTFEAQSLLYHVLKGPTARTAVVCAALVPLVTIASKEM